VGEHALDPVGFDETFVPATASAAERARWDEIQLATGAFSDALGSVIAHETGHALGLVAPGPPGGGLFGGAIGPDLGHNLTAGGATPTQSWIMNAGSTYTFPKLSGLGGNLLPVFRPLNFAYLRDRALIDGAVTDLLLPPGVDSVSPSVVTIGPSVTLVVQGAGFRPTPSIRLESPGFNYEVSSEGFDSESQITGIVVTLQTLPGVYDVKVTNSDGQVAVLEDAFTIQ
jgi:hypothetical protein